MSTIDHLSELESLRSQVADLSRKIAERDRLDLLRAIVEGTAADTGEELFQSLVTHLARTLNVRYALVGELTGPGAERIRSLAFCSDGRLLESVEYEILETPFRLVVDQTLLVFEQGLREQFPNARRLADLGAESFCGMTLRDKSGKVLGVLAIMDDKPLQDRADLRSLMTICAARASAELERNGLVDALDRSQQFLYSIVEHIPLAVFAKDAKDNFNIVLWNKKAEDMFGITRAQMLGKNAHDYWPQKEADFFLACDQQAMVEGKIIDVPEEPSTHPVKGRRTLCTKKVPLLDHEKNPRYLLTLCEDITERKVAEEALRESEERFDLAVRGSNTGIWDWDLRTNKTYFSPLWKSMLGYEAHELRGEFSEWEVRLHPDDRERALATVQAYLKGGLPQYQLEHRLRHKDGGYRWILARGVSISDAEGKPYRMAGSHIDITEQKQTQEALSRSEHQLRTVLDMLPVGVWFTDLSGKPILANPAARQIWSGVKQVGIKTAANGTGWWEAIGPSGELHRWALSHVLTKGVPSLNETLDLECIDGTKKTIRNTTVPVQDEAGVLLGAIVLNEDITLLRQAQEALKLTQFSVDHAVEGFFWIGFDARILNVNDAACRMLEYTRDELTTMMIHDINPSFPPETWLAHWEELKQKGSLKFESKHWSRTGRVLDTEVTVNYLQYEGREYSCAIMRDIGERKRAEEVLQNSEERFTKAFRVSSHLIGITEFDTGCCVDVNDACLEMFGYRREEVIGQSTITLGLWPRSEDRDRLLRTIKDDGMIRNLERSITTKNGEVRQVVISSDPVQINGIPCLLTVGHDVTERKRTEEALRQRERDLRAAIEERERISQDLHDGILQSLFAVGLSLETTKSRMSPKECKSSGPALMQAIDQLNRLMQEVRNFIAGLGSDLLQGKDLPTALHQMLESLTKHHPTRVRLKIEDRAARALSTEQSLHLLLVIQEAVTNCIRHGRAQEATVSLKLLKQVIRLSVRDNGCGFNPNAAKGTGHGLVNMAARARRIGGRLTLSSNVNEGTRVVLDLPKEASLVHR